jgi:hypothetical protein
MPGSGYIQFTNPVSVKFTRSVPPRFSMTPLFSDNSLVYYKHGSLASGGIGTVKNSGHKAKKT